MYKGRLLVRPSEIRTENKNYVQSFNISLMNKCIAIVKNNSLNYET